MEQERGGIQVLERTKATLLTGVFDAGEHRRDQLVKQVEDVVEGRDFLNFRKGEEGGLASRRRHPCDSLCPCCGSVPCQGVDPDGRHGGKLDGAHPQIPDLAEPLQGLDQAGDTDPSWGAAEPLQGRLPGRFVGDQQGLQTGRLLGFQGPCQGAPQSRGGQVTDLGDQAGQHRDSRQQYLAFDQAGRGQVEEDAGSFGTDPGPVGEPAGQGGGLRALVEVEVAIATADLGGVIPAFLASCVASQAIGIVDVQLPGQVGHDSRGDFGQVGQEGAQEPHGPDLRREPETVVITTASGDEPTILVVEVEVAFELGGRWLARIAAIAPLLILGQEVDRHPSSFLKSPIRLGARCQIGSPSPRHRLTLEIIGFPEPRSCDKMSIPQLALYKPGGQADKVEVHRSWERSA